MKFTVKGMLVMLILVIHCLLPPILIIHTARASRTAWYMFFVLSFLVPSFLAMAATPAIPKPKLPPHRAIHSTLLLLFIAAVWLTIAACNNIERNAQVALTAEQLVRFIKPTFPWISAFQHISVGPPAYEHQYLKIETIMSLWFVFGLSASVLIILNFFVMTPPERAYHRAVTDQVEAKRGKPHGPMFYFFGIIFGIGCGLTALFGTWDFNGETSGKHCIISVACYMNDDLGIIAAAAFKSVVIFGIGLGGLLMFPPRLWSLMFETPNDTTGGTPPTSSSPAA